MTMCPKWLRLLPNLGGAENKSYINSVWSQPVSPVTIDGWGYFDITFAIVYIKNENSAIWNLTFSISSYNE